ncbi:MAG TPA: ribonuclease Y [Dehalococcoidia bacterium]|jgi:ribonuclease Y|nr:ribonuclease Y [Dehalococcoidia bacterium]
MLVLVIVLAVVAILAFGAVVVVLQRGRANARLIAEHAAREEAVRAAEDNARRIVSEAETRQKEVLLEAKEEAIRLRTQTELELRERGNEVQRQERRIVQKEESLDRKAEAFERRERALAAREQELEETRAKLEELRAQRLAEIERIAQLSSQEARDLLMAEVEREVREDAVRRVQQIEAEYRETANRRAREILVAAIQRVSSDVTAETTVSVVPIPSDDMKGRIIGREGRNIRALEQATGCDLIIDDTPDAVTLSGFDPVRREIARIALGHLVHDGRIHPTRIEEVVEKARQEVEGSLRSQGEAAAVEAGAPSLHPELMRLLGKLKFRLSNGQSVLRHSVETAQVGAMLATELGADVAVVRRAGLLHDIGMAVDQDVEGNHTSISADLAKRYGMPAAVVHCIEAHHGDVEPRSVEAVILQIADSVSRNRPGAQREALEHFVRRLEELESLIGAFDGVDKAFAIQAGREVRVIVRPDEIDDLASMRLARDVSRKIEESLEYPGQIKVTVIRETRNVEYAR